MSFDLKWFTTLPGIFITVGVLLLIIALIILIVSGLLLFIPGSVTDIAGLAITAALLLLNLKKWEKGPKFLMNRKAG